MTLLVTDHYSPSPHTPPRRQGARERRKWQGGPVKGRGRWEAKRNNGGGRTKAKWRTVEKKDQGKRRLRLGGKSRC